MTRSPIEVTTAPPCGLGLWRRDRRLLQRIIDLSNQEPCPSMGHAQMSGGPRNRSFGSNSFEQGDFARSNAIAVN
jgi:hypothetical protein